MMNGHEMMMMTKTKKPTKIKTKKRPVGVGALLLVVVLPVVMVTPVEGAVARVEDGRRMREAVGIDNVEALYAAVKQEDGVVVEPELVTQHDVLLEALGKRCAM